jgi:hypothetical protein
MRATSTGAVKACVVTHRAPGEDVPIHTTKPAPVATAESTTML